MENEINKMVEDIKSKIGENIILEESKKKEKKRFFISDTHFNDSRLNLYGRDLVFKDAKEVNNHIIEVWNKTIEKNDLVYHLGDISMDKDGLEILNQLNGEKVLIKGNYDINIENSGTAKYEINDKILSKYFTKVVDELEIEIGGETVYLNHFPTNAKSDKFNIVGHIHGLWKVQRNMINVGVDAWHFTPVSEDLIKFQMNGIRKHYDQNCFPGELVASVKNRHGEVKVLRAPEYDKVATFEESKDVYVFFGGCIQGTNPKVLWQEEFIKKIQEELKSTKLNKNIVLCSPRRLEKPDKDKFVYSEQVDWEEKYLEKAMYQGIIVFWLDKEFEKIEGRSFCQTSRFELGWIFEAGKHIENFIPIIGAHKEFEGQRYIKYKFERTYPGFEMKTNKDDVIKEIIKQIKKMI
jgi:calcineurin-like phosphoesterase family protein